LAPEASNFIGGLLTVDCRTRLGCGRTLMRDVKTHPWFDGLDWGMLLERRVRPPFAPKISNPLDTKNFEPYDEHENDIDTFEQPLDTLDELFNNF
jgi:serine/threonine protein kinase